MRKAIIELDLKNEIIHLDGYLVANDCLIVIEKSVMWMYQVYKRENSGIYGSKKAGLWLGKLKNEEVDEQLIILQVLSFMQNLTVFDFFRNHYDWSIDYDFCFVEAVS